MTANRQKAEAQKYLIGPQDPGLYPVPHHEELEETDGVSSLFWSSVGLDALQMKKEPAYPF